VRTCACWSSTTLLVVFAGARRIKLSHWRHFGRGSGGLSLRQAAVGVASIAAYIAGLGLLIHGPRSLCLRMGSRLWQKLLEIVEKVGSRYEEVGDLCVDVLDGFGLALVGLENLEELLVDFWLLGESVLVVKSVNRSLSQGAKCHQP
jgi:hypothetical protein